MPKEIVSSLTFVGDRFSVSLFDEQELCDDFGPLTEERFRAGDIGRFRYMDGEYEFRVELDRINLVSYKQDIVPPELMKAAQKIAAKLESVKSDIEIFTVGISCNCIFSSEEIGEEGIDFCRTLADTSFSRRFFEKSPPFTATVTFSLSTFSNTTVHYAMRFEPDGESGGEDIAVAINGHDHIEEEDSLKEKLEVLEEVRGNVEAIHGRLRLFAGSEGE